MIGNIFSKEAMDKLRSPERLDMMLEVTNPVGWMTLAAMGVLLFSIVIWSIFGAMVVKVEGVGVLLDAGGISSVIAVNSGQVERLYVYPGARVKKGDLLVSLDQPDQQIATKLARSEMELSTSRQEAVMKAAQYDSSLYQQDVNTYIRSEFEGIVDEVSVEPGSVVSAGSSICTVRKYDNSTDLTGVFYVPVSNGKRVEPGMTLQLAPNGVDTSEDGSLLAVVRSVSQYPVSANSMYKNVGNEQLVQWILSKTDNAAMEVQFELVKDESSDSGYLWTSIVGKHKPVTSGSVCTGFVIVDRKPPIEKVFYKISQWLRSR